MFQKANEEEKEVPFQALQKMDISPKPTPTITTDKTNTQAISGEKRKLAQTEEVGIIYKDEDVDAQKMNPTNANNQDPDAPKQTKQKQVTMGNLSLQMRGVNHQQLKQQTQPKIYQQLLPKQYSLQ